MRNAEFGISSTVVTVSHCRRNRPLPLRIAAFRIPDYSPIQRMTLQGRAGDCLDVGNLKSITIRDTVATL